MSSAVRPFRIETSEAQLSTLRERLRTARWPEAETVDDWSQGIPLAYLKDLCRYWSEEYDWRRTESRINAIPQFTTELDGLGIHYLHVRSPHAGALPLIITHGWPGSIVEFLKAIGPLTDPVAHGGDAADAFDVVCPSLPGYGYSDKPAREGWGVERIAGAWAQLICRSRRRHPPQHAGGRTRPERPGAPHRGGGGRPGGVGPLSEVGVGVLQGAVDPPSDGRLRPSARLYWQSGRVSRDPVEVPTGCSIFPKEIARTSRRWAARRYTDIRYWNELDRGGHFAAFEQPALFVDELRSFFRLVR
jgi:pimeloyl-ACP methyl ester carboxylesterase